MASIRIMDDTDVTRLRTRLEAMLAALDAENALGREGRRTVALDQQSVGRLSRMDALQQQAMARAIQARRSAAATRIHAALARIDEGEYGCCTECGEEIAPERLDIDPAIPTCVSCARG